MSTTDTDTDTGLGAMHEGKRGRSGGSAVEVVPIGPLIRLTRRERGLTQYQLADALAGASGNDGVGRDEVSRWERGKRVPGPYWQHWLASVLDVAPDRLRIAARIARTLRAHRVGSLFSAPPGSSDSLGRVGS